MFRTAGTELRPHHEDLVAQERFDLPVGITVDELPWIHGACASAYCDMTLERLLVERYVRRFEIGRDVIGYLLQDIARFRAYPDD